MEVEVVNPVVYVRETERSKRVVTTGNVHTGVSGHHGHNVAPPVVRVRELGREHVMVQTLGNEIRQAH